MRFAKRSIIVVLTMASTVLSARAELREPLAPVQEAALAAAADGASTLGALSAGAVERNAMLPASPIGIVALTAAKMGLAKWADELPEPRRSESLKSMTAVFGGAATNNLMVIAGATNALAALSGLAGGVFFWTHMDRSLKEQAKAVAKAERERQPVTLAMASRQTKWNCPAPMIK